MSRSSSRRAPFKTVLIANRGEIAVRVMAGVQQLGATAVAVYSDVDATAMHVRAADRAIHIGPAPARESYLNIPRIITAAREAGAEAIHPGYGFLSENAEFAQACADAGIVFIGPPPDAIRLMGSKTAAKRAVEQAGVPTVPGYMGAARDTKTLEREAARVGYPIMLKAAAGGGGKGMRVVQAASEFTEALEAAQREALAAFGDETVFIEKLVVAPRHVEFQILADAHGHTIHLGERECSIQRRHQKIIEESPCIALTPELRAEMGAAAVAAARSAGYVNAGTCEFLLDQDGRYYFLEMNTRLQVEHPVTESVTGFDLVRWQLAIAAGEPLTIQQRDVFPRGHAIEARLYAEDPAQGYLPSSGRALVVAAPRAPGVRVDAGIESGDEVTVNYDPMLAKLVAHAENRADAIARMRWALDHYAILGVATNSALLSAIVDEPDYQAGKTNTAYLETHAFETLADESATPPEALAATALWETLASAQPTRARGEPFNPWRSGAAASAAGGERAIRYTRAGASHTVRLRASGDARYALTVDDQPFPSPDAPVSATLGEGGRLTLACGDQRETLYVARRGYDTLIWRRGQVYTLARSRPLDVDLAAHSADVTPGAQTLTAPMSGTIIKVNVREGDLVEARQTLVVLGAMKMEHAITAPHAGKVRRVAHAAGDVVQGGATLVELAAIEEASHG
ncbi:MAG TPA: acetyl-CoA carboxylase biotin carboxylase subunit [Ktedonobacterales bacterium]